MICHFFGPDVPKLDQDGHSRREVLFGSWPELKGRDILVVDAALDSGGRRGFFCAVCEKGRQRPIRLAALRDQPGKRRTDAEPDYFGFLTASNQVWVGYGLAASKGTGERSQRAYLKSEHRLARMEKESMREAACGAFRN